MTNTEKVIEIVVNAINEELDGYEVENWKELLRYLGLDTEEFKDEFVIGYTEGSEWWFVGDDGSVLDDTVKGGVTTYRQLMAKVRKSLGF